MPMIDLNKLNLPFSNLIIIVTVLFLILLITPIITKKLRIPSIIGLIIFGAVVGPNGINIISINDGIKLLGEIGLMMIMFLAGIELEFSQLKENKQKSIFFGFITVLLPAIVLFTATYLYYQLSLTTSLLISLMFSSQTLVAYPVVSRSGLSNHTSSITAIGGTVIADAFILFLIGIIISGVKTNLTFNYIITFILSITAFILIVSFLLPYIVKKIFSNFEDTENLFFLLIITTMFLSASLAYLVGLEAILGAFLAGISLNRYIPKTSSLMSNLQFIGNTIFIPCFLFYVGTFINFSLIFDNTSMILFSIVIIIIAIICKYLSSYITGKLFKFKKTEISLLFGLSTTRAAAVIAVAIVCFEENLINNYVLNTAVLLIAVSCIFGVIITERACRKILLAKDNNAAQDYETIENILVPYANPNNINILLDVAATQLNSTKHSIIYPLAVITENTEYKQTVNTNKNILEKLIKHSYPSYIQFQPSIRIDTNPVSGILRATKELMITSLIIGWTGRTTKFETLGSNIYAILEQTSIQTLICHINNATISTFSKLIAIVPKYAEYEKGFKKWLFSINSFKKNLSYNTIFISEEATCNSLKETCSNLRINTKSKYIYSNNENETINTLDRIYDKNSLIVIIAGRNKSISYNTSTDHILRIISQSEKNKNFIVLFPEEYS